MPSSLPATTPLPYPCRALTPHPHPLARICRVLHDPRFNPDQLVFNSSDTFSKYVTERQENDVETRHWRTEEISVTVADVPALPADAVYTSTFRFKDVRAWLAEQFSEEGYCGHFALHAAKRFNSKGDRCVAGQAERSTSIFSARWLVPWPAHCLWQKQICQATHI